MASLMRVNRGMGGQPTAAKTGIQGVITLHSKANQEIHFSLQSWTMKIAKPLYQFKAGVIPTSQLMQQAIRFCIQGAEVVLDLFGLVSALKQRNLETRL